MRRIRFRRARLPQRAKQAKLDANAGEPYAFATLLCARRNVVVSSKLPPLHPTPIIDDGQRGVGGVGQQADTRRARVKGVGDDFSEDRFLERTRVGVPEVLEEMLEVDTSFAHAGILSRRSGRFEATH